MQWSRCIGLSILPDAGGAALTDSGWSPENCSGSMLYGGAPFANEYRDSFVRKEIALFFGCPEWEELSPNLTTECLLETEATATTLLHLFNSSLTRPDQKFCTANEDIYDPLQLGDAYASVLRRMINFVSSLDFSMILRTFGFGDMS